MKEGGLIEFEPCLVRLGSFEAKSQKQSDEQDSGAFLYWRCYGISAGLGTTAASPGWLNNELNGPVRNAGV